MLNRNHNIFRESRCVLYFVIRPTHMSLLHSGRELINNISKSRDERLPRYPNASTAEGLWQLVQIVVK
jgi:hypothetical protein